MVADFLVFQFTLDAAPDVAGEASTVAERYGDFRLIVGSEVVFEDGAFPLDQFADALREWLARSGDAPQPFVFREGSPVLPPVIQISPGIEGWHVTSVQREFSSPLAFTQKAVEEAAERFIAELDAVGRDRAAGAAGRAPRAE
jgi:hypothetical protein